LTILLTV